MYKIELPYPPSLDCLYHPWKGRMVLSNTGKQYKSLVALAVRDSYFKKQDMLLRDTKCAVLIEVYPPDHRRRDLDNLLKIVLDAFTGIIYEDDSQVDGIGIVRCDLCKPLGKIIVTIDVYQC